GVAAGHDPLEVAEVGRQVQGEGVADDRAVQLDPDRGELEISVPDPGQAGLPRLPCDTQPVQVGDERLLELLEVPGDGEPEVPQVDDRVADELARTVVGRLAAAVRPDHLDMAPVALRFVPEQVVGGGGFAHGEDVRVLEQQQGVFTIAGPQLPHQLGLEIPGFAVGDATQPAGSYARQGSAHRR